MRKILGRAVLARGDFDTAEPGPGRGARRPPGADLVGELRRLGRQRRKPAITTLDNLLFDTLVHVQDVAVPLGPNGGRCRSAAAREGDERVWRMGWPF